MEIREVIIAEYEQFGRHDYPEDTWSDECEIQNREDLYKFMVEIHKRDSMNFSNYPLGGCCSFNGFKFKVEERIIIDGKIFKGPRKDCDCSEWFLFAKSKYESLIKRASKSIPSMRKLAKKRKINKKEHELYLLLKEKFK